MIKKIGKGKILSFKKILFKQGKRISRQPIYPMFLTELEIIKPLSEINNHIMAEIL